MFSLYAPNFTHSSKQTIFVVSLDVLTNVINTSFTIMKNHKIKAKGSKFTHISSKLKKKKLVSYSKCIALLWDLLRTRQQDHQLKSFVASCGELGLPQKNLSFTSYKCSSR